MAERKPLFQNDDGPIEQMATTDTATFGGLTISSAAGIAMGGFKITNLGAPTAAGDAANKAYVDSIAVSSRAWKEVLLTREQLLSGATGAVLQAIAAYIATNPTANDTFIITDGTVTETFTFKAAEAVAFDVAIGGSAAATMTNLIQAINDDSTLWSAVGTTGLDDYFAAAPTAQMVVYRTANSNNNDRVYGTLTAPAGIKVAEFNTSGIGDYAVGSSTESNLPAADPAAKRFGFSRAFASLYTNETHLIVEDITTWTWDTDDDAWRQTDASATSAGAGLVRTGATIDVELDTAAGAQTAGNGGGSSGLEFDAAGAGGKLRAAVHATGGLERTGTGLAAKLNGTTLQSAAGGLSVKGLPALFEIATVATSANVTAANVNALVDAGQVTGLHFHRDLKADIPVNESIAVADPVCPSTVADRVDKAQAGTDSKRFVLGVAETAQAVAGSTARIAMRGVAVGVLVGATPGQRFYLAATGGLTAANTPPGAGNNQVLVLIAKNATDAWVHVTEYAKKAA